MTQNNNITITEEMKDSINGFLGAELIPSCAVGSEIAYHNGDIVIKTFKSGSLEGWRKLSSMGEVINIIAQFGR